MTHVVDAVLIGRVASLPEDRGHSAIAKKPVPDAMAVAVRADGLVGDEQGDRRHHGGPDKAIHHYARDHYDVWREWSPDSPVLTAPGAFGENISTTGLTEDDVHLGDIFTLGTAVVQVSQGRQPCWKLDVRLGRRGTARRMQELALTGWYYRVLEEGEVRQGDLLELVERPEPHWPLSRLLRALFDRSTGPVEWQAAAELPTLSENWRQTFAKRLAHGRIEDWSSRLR